MKNRTMDGLHLFYICNYFTKKVFLKKKLKIKTKFINESIFLREN